MAYLQLHSPSQLRRIKKKYGRLNQLPQALARGYEKMQYGFSQINKCKMPFVKVFIHFVWSTKNRVQTFNTPELRKKVWQHMRENAKKKNLFIDFVNGHAEHCHCLVSLGVDQSISKVMQLVKGESAFWFNRQGFTKQKLEWQDEYFAVSVSESQLDNVRNYIKNQEEHHKHKTFQQEYDEFISKYGFEKFAD